MKHAWIIPLVLSLWMQMPFIDYILDKDKPATAEGNAFLWIGLFFGAVIWLVYFVLKDWWT